MKNLTDFFDNKSNELHQTIFEIERIKSFVSSGLYNELDAELKDAILAQGHALALNRLAIKAQIKHLNNTLPKANDFQSQNIQS